MGDHGSKLSTDPRSDPNSGKRDSFSDEVEEFGYSSVVESGLVQTDSMEARQLQSAETEVVTSLGEVFLGVLLPVLLLFLEDFLGGSGEWVGAKLL